MNRDNEEQRPISQTLCGALQKEANCKCLVLSVLIYGCLAAVTWCRCAYVPKVFINYSKFPLRTTRHVSPCDDGYIYIPVAFMGMLYLVYLVECYHSPIRIDLRHSESQDSVFTKLSQLRLVQPTIWWKAVSYHYVRRKRQVTRYRNGDNYTTTQVYYERVNTHAATSLYFYDYCGVKDISKDLAMDSKLPITKITLSKGFAFSNMRSATEFEEARSRFFAEQELRDDYMEMREGLDLGYNFNSSTTLVAVLGKPWFTNSYVYWCLSALLLSWPLRIIIECNTQYADYQITKLFGINYDTPTSGNPIHASCSQLNAPGNYMLAPSYSEALLMEPVGQSSAAVEHQNSNSSTTVDQFNYENDCDEMIVPSYSEALLYERAAINGNINPSTGLQDIACSVGRSESMFAMLPPTLHCECPCHRHRQEEPTVVLVNSNKPSNEDCSSLREQSPDISLCNICNPPPLSLASTRDNTLAESNLKTNSGDLHLMRGMSLQFLRTNGSSLENIMENEETAAIASIDGDRGMGAIPKRRPQSEMISSSFSANRPDTLINFETTRRKIPESKTYLCLKAILKQNKRRYTLVTTDELKNLTNNDDDGGVYSNSLIQLRESSSGFKKRQMLPPSVDPPTSRRDCWNRTLIFPSPIHEIRRGNDPFVGSQRFHNLPPNEATPLSNLPVFTRLGTSLTVLAEPSTSKSTNKCKIDNSKRHHQRTQSIEPQYLKFITQTTNNDSNNASQTTISGNNSLSRSLTERRPNKPSTQYDKTLRRSFTDERTEFSSTKKRMNLNMETSL